MTKDNSGHSSTACSTHAPSPRENGLEVPEQDARQPDEATPNMSRSPSSIAFQSKPANADTLVAPAAESQPMTASNSNSSNPSAIDGVGNGTGPAPYGTRSRNRTGTSRPNYAEDKELDAEFEITVSSKEGRKATRGADPSPSTTVDPGRSVNNARKPQAAESDQVLGGQGHYKEPIPGTSTFSANPITNVSTGQPSKKRKANGTPATSSLQPQMPIPNHGTVPAITRRASIAAQGLAGSRETNMLSFDDCGSRLKDKKLFADDGTVLEVNGETNELLRTEPWADFYFRSRIPCLRATRRALLSRPDYGISTCRQRFHTAYRCIATQLVLSAKRYWP
jgi:hypothetical protein